MTYDDARRLALDGKIQSQSDADLDLLLKACLATDSSNPAFITKRDQIILVSRGEMDGRRHQRQHEQQLAEHSKLHSAVRELKKPHWTLTPSFWVSVLAMIFAAIAAWPGVKEWIPARQPAHRDGLATTATVTPAKTFPFAVAAETNEPSQKYKYKIEGEWILGPTLKWPLRGSDGSLWATREGFKVLEDRWNHGTTARLSATDDAAIRKVIIAKLFENPKIGELKRITECEYMVEGSWYTGRLDAGSFWFVVVRSKNDWVLIARYVLVIS